MNEERGSLTEKLAGMLDLPYTIIDVYNVTFPEPIQSVIVIQSISLPQQSLSYRLSLMIFYVKLLEIL